MDGEGDIKFSSETKVHAIALARPGARRILEDAGVDYCCGGGKSLQEACLHADVPAEEILNRLHQNSQLVDPEETQWTSRPLAELTRHIRQHHHRYVRDASPRFRALLARVREKHGAKHPEVEYIEKLFGAVAREMIIRGSLEPLFFQTVRNPIHMMMKEHDAAGEKLKQIRRTTAEYQPPQGACTTFRALYQGLREFEEDLNEHVHLENNILFPRAVGLEVASR